MRAPKNIAKGTAKLIAYFPGSKTNPKPALKEIPIGLDPNTPKEATQTILFENTPPKKFTLEVKDSEGKTVHKTENATPGKNTFTLPKFGTYYTTYTAPGYLPLESYVQYINGSLRIYPSLTLLQKRKVTLTFAHSEPESKLFTEKTTTITWPQQSVRTMNSDWDLSFAESQLDGSPTVIIRYSRRDNNMGYTIAKQPFKTIKSPPENWNKLSSIIELKEGQTIIFDNSDQSNHPYTKLQIQKIETIPLPKSP